jgi:hypothetical protein
MNGAMVRATLRQVDPKTQTRRLLKQAIGPSLSVDCQDGIATLSWLHGDGPGYPVEETVMQVACPYGVLGDRLWVRESFWGCDGAGWGDTPCVVYDDEWHGKHYQAAEIRPWAPKFGRIPSIHMPRACSRITLEVISVRVERLQGISEEDALAEGVEQDAQGFHIDGGRHFHAASARESYASLWDSLKPPTGSTWADNPWVWVVNFKRI